MTRKVLIVDDDDDIRDSMVDFLTEEGYLAIGMRGGEQALSHLAWAALPDVILLDFNMPGMNGGEVVGRLSENPRWGGIPVILCSGSSLGAVRRDLSAQVFAVLPKPFDLDHLMELVKKA